MTLEYKLPGPRMIASASAIASSASGMAASDILRSGRGRPSPRPARNTRAIGSGLLRAGMFDSPTTIDPSLSSAHSTAGSRVGNMIFPSMPSRRLTSRMALRTSPSCSCAKATMRRFPALWPPRVSPSAVLKRWLKNCVISGTRAGSARASRQLRRSPGGRVSYSRIRRPELPPSSEKETIAVTDERSMRSQPRHFFWRYSRRPRRTTGRPVPPPMQTMRYGRVSTDLSPRREAGRAAAARRRGRATRARRARG